MRGRVAFERALVAALAVCAPGLALPRAEKEVD
jgi:hypothetical protein